MIQKGNKTDPTQNRILMPWLSTRLSRSLKPAPHSLCMVYEQYKLDVTQFTVLNTFKDMAQSVQKQEAQLYRRIQKMKMQLILKTILLKFRTLFTFHTSVWAKRWSPQQQTKSQPPIPREENSGYDNVGTITTSK